MELMDNVAGLRDRLGVKIQSLPALPSARSSTLWVGLSGGLDSTVLLDAVVHCGALPAGGVAVIHVNHQLAEAADAWEAHCRGLADAYGLPFESTRLTLGDAGNIEANARSARYQFFARTLSSGDYLLTAHHADDQLETILLKLLQGRAFKGMDDLTRVAGVAVFRPLLDTPRGELVAYAQTLGLRWVEDPSNQDTALDRNYLRHEIVPKLLERWPQAGHRVADLAQSQGALDAAARWGVSRYQREHPDGLAQKDLPEVAGHARVWLRLYVEALGHYQVTDATIDEFLRQFYLGQQARVNWRDGVLEIKNGGIQVTRHDK